jgi:outer membrane protein assembly factor BamB
MSKACATQTRVVASPAFRGSAFTWMGLVFAMLFSGTAMAALPATLTPTIQLVPAIGVSQELNDIPTADFDGDGLLDVVVAAPTNYSMLLQIYGFEEGEGWVVKQSIVMDSDGGYLTGWTFSAWVDASGAHLLQARGTRVNIFSGWPLALSRSFEVQPPDIIDSVVGDADNDGNLELIVRGDYYATPVRAISLQTGVDLWSASIPDYYQGGDIELAQLDADPALEMVLSGTPGIVLDGATRAVEWTYKDGFGSIIHSPRFGGTSPRFAALQYDKLVMFQGNPWSPLWDLVDLGTTMGYAASDLDADGFDEILLSSNGYPEEIRVVDVVTQAVRATINGISGYQLASADFDGDGQTEIATVGMRGEYPNHNVGFFVVDGLTGATEYESPKFASGLYLAGTFLQNAGDVDLVFGSTYAENRAGFLTRVNASTGEVRWRTAVGQPLNLAFLKDLKVANLEGEINPTLLALGSNVTEKLVALDSTSGSVLWSIDNNDIPGSFGTWFEGFAAVSQDAGALADAVLVCTSESKLRLFNISDQTWIWSSVQMNGSCVDAMQITTNGSKQLVAVLDHVLRAYDAQTHLLSWSMPIDYGVTGATYLPQGVAGPEIAVILREEVRFFDAETRALLRTFSLGTYSEPVQAIAQPENGSIHDLAVTIGDHLHVLDGETGELRGTSPALGLNAGLNNQLPVFTNPDGSWLVGVGSDVAVLTYRVESLSDTIFANGFEDIVP